MKKITGLLIALLVIVILSTAGCASSRDASESTMSAPAAMPAPATAPSMDMTGEKGYSSDVSNRGETSDADRKIVRTGNISIEVADIEASMADIADLAQQMGGYVVSSNLYGNDESSRGNVSIRVPSDRFDEALGRLRQLAVKVLQESTNSRDLTEEYTDLQAKLNNLQATETQYLALLQKAQRVEDVIAVQRELTNVRTQIDQIKGRMLYIDRTAEMSMIQVSIRQKASIGDKGWSAGQTLTSALNGLVIFGKVIVNVIIWLIVFFPVWLIPLLIIRHRRKKAKQLAVK